MTDPKPARTPAEAGKLARERGARFEREVARELHALTGITFARRLKQYQKQGLDDLEPSDPAFPFALELKTSARNSFAVDWRRQAVEEARKLDRLPALVFRLASGPIRVAVPFEVMFEACGGTPGDCPHWAETTLEGLAYLAAELMARRA